MRIPGFCYLLLLVIFSGSSFAQSLPDSTLASAPRIYIDCGFCDMEFIRQELKFVNHVRDRKVADVHVLATSQETGSGGNEFTLFLIGQMDFEGMDDTLKFTAGPNDTEQEIRERGLKLLKIGLLPYILKTPAWEQIEVSSTLATDPLKVEDAWRNWTFNLDVGGWFSGEQSYNNINAWASVDVSKITPELKMEYDLGSFYNQSIYFIGDDIVRGVTRGYNFDVLVVSSINDHWSFGGVNETNSSLFRNIKISNLTAPAIEFNIFPYSKSARKQLRILYSAGYSYQLYNDTTIFNKLEQGLTAESLSLSFQIKEKWGSIGAYVEGFHYFHDFRLNHFALDTRISLRLFKGFSFLIRGNFSIIHDQLFLPKAGASEEEILLRQRQIATQYSYFGNIGLTYTFGSIYNNVVNPRFGD